MLAELEQAVLVVVDIQEKFRPVLPDFDRIVYRTQFLIECALSLEVPILVSEQNPEKLGSTAEEIIELIPEVKRYPKMAFSALGSIDLEAAFWKLERRQIVLVGIETHICICQTAYHGLSEELDVFLCDDAVGSRSSAAHMSGLQRLADVGVTVCPTESIVYEWMGAANHPQFPEILDIVKAYA